jgi:hypothetical protein
VIDNLIKVYDDLFKSERIKELAQVANEYQLPFEKRASFSDQILQIKGFKLFQVKGAKRFLGIISQATTDFPGHIRFYDFAYTKDLETYTTSVIEITSEELFSDYFLIQPKGTLTKFKDFFVADHKLFPRLDDFHANFEISTKTSDAMLLVRESALSLLTKYPHITVEAEGNHFLFYTRKKMMPVHKIINTINFAEDFVDLLYFDEEDDFV